MLRPARVARPPAMEDSMTKQVDWSYLRGG
jgi:hypothetical protein